MTLRVSATLFRTLSRLPLSILLVLILIPGTVRAQEADGGAPPATAPATAPAAPDAATPPAAPAALGRPVVTVLPDQGGEARLLADCGIVTTPVADIPAALATAPGGVLVIDATPANLAELVLKVEDFRQYLANHGTVMLWGVTPDGLDDFNKLVGEAHLLRPSGEERLAPGSSALLSGLAGTSYQLQEPGSASAFGAVVDTGEVAPFAQWPGPDAFGEAGAAPGSAGWPRNLVDGGDAGNPDHPFLIPVTAGQPVRWTLTFPRPVELERFAIALDPDYHQVTHVKLTFDGNVTGAQDFDLMAGPGRQDFALQPVTASSVTVELSAWDNNGTRELVGLTGFWLGSHRAPDFARRVQPLIEPAGLVNYRFGGGNVILNQIAVQDGESGRFYTRKNAVLERLFNNLGVALAPAGKGLIWIESEDPASADGPINRLSLPEASGGTCIGVTAGFGLDDAAPPVAGVTLHYYFDAAGSGLFHVWNRIGDTAVGTGFRWRVDSGDWHNVAPDAPFVDQVYTRGGYLAWLPLGDVTLGAGSHILDINALPATPGDSGRWIFYGAVEHYIPASAAPAAPRLSYLSDALCLTQESGSPDGPGARSEYKQSEADAVAAAQIFTLPLPAAGGRVSLKLNGLWMTGRYDEPGDETTRREADGAVPDPDALLWKGISLPGDRNLLLPAESGAHRAIYRARVQVPQESAGADFFLDFKSTACLASVFVNGQFMGSSDAPFAPWRCDISAGIKPGQVNEIWVVVKDAYYGRRSPAGATNLMPVFSAPIDTTVGLAGSFDWPVKDLTATGILDEVILSAASPAHIDDVFVKSSVSAHQLGLEITLKNAGPTACDVVLTNQVVPSAGGAVEKQFEPVNVHLDAGERRTVNLAESWPHPHLWWPDDPRRYIVVTTLSQAGAPLDQRNTKFGFREWSIRGNQLLLNGVPQHLRADASALEPAAGETPQNVIARWKAHGQNLFFLDGTLGWAGLGQSAALDLFDQEGIVVVRCVSSLHGSGEPYRLDNPGLMSVVHDQWIAHVRAERNHPSIALWNLEDRADLNFGPKDADALKTFEVNYSQGAHEIAGLDPTRPVMVAGARALMDQSLPVYGATSDPDPIPVGDYPDEAYSFARSSAPTGLRPWPMTLGDRPLILSQVNFLHAYAPGRFTKSGGDVKACPYWDDLEWPFVETDASNPAPWFPERFAAVGGERAFEGKWASRYAEAWEARMLAEGARWAGVAAVDFNFGADTVSQYTAWKPVAALCRQWNWSFASGDTVPRTYRVFNDTHSSDPIEFDAVFLCKTPRGPVVRREPRLLTVPEGGWRQLDLALVMPAVAVRTEAELVLTCRRDGAEVFRDVKALAILPGRPAPTPGLPASALAVWDPSGLVAARLTRRGIPFTAIPNLDALTPDATTLIVGPDAVTPDLATSDRWIKLTAAGLKILVLDQTNPLHGAALPVTAVPTTVHGEIAFPLVTSSPAFYGLAEHDFFVWSGDHCVYRNPYLKPAGDCDILAESDAGLTCTPLVVCPSGRGALVLSQFAVGNKLASDAVARRLFDNLVNLTATWAPRPGRAVATVLDEDSPRAVLLQQLGLQCRSKPDPLAALSEVPGGVAIIDATPDNLKLLAAHEDQVKAFTTSGGYLMLWGVTPDGLDSFDALTGVPHLLRPYALGTYALSSEPDALTAGLSNADVKLDSSHSIDPGNPLAAHVWLPASDAFTNVVDLDDITAFCTLSSPEHWGGDAMAPVTADGTPVADGAASAHWPGNLTDGLTRSDGWPHPFVIDAGHGAPLNWTMTLPETASLKSFALECEGANRPTQIKLTFDGNAKTAVVLALNADRAYNVFYFSPRQAKSVEVEITGQSVASLASGLVEIDEIWLKAAKPAEYWNQVKPLLTVGGLVRYPEGAGGILLNQLNIPATESNPETAAERRYLVWTLLRNLGAPFGAPGTATPAPAVAAPGTAAPAPAADASVPATPAPSSPVPSAPAPPPAPAPAN